MKIFKRIAGLTLALTLALSLLLVPAGAQASTLFSENFAKMEGEYPDSFIPFTPGSVQVVEKGAFTISGGGEYGVTDHGAIISIPDSAERITVSFKLRSGSGMMTAVAFANGGKAAQARLMEGVILASFGGPYDFMPVGSYADDWVRIVMDLDFTAATYDVYVDDCLAAEDLALSDEALPVNFLFGALGTESTSSIDNILIKVKN